jgi:hypothetical protein
MAWLDHHSGQWVEASWLAPYREGDIEVLNRPLEVTVATQPAKMMFAIQNWFRTKLASGPKGEDLYLVVVRRGLCPEKVIR